MTKAETYAKARELLAAAFKASHVPMKSNGLVTGKPCLLCGKAIRHDYDGICMDCADELGLSEMFMSRS